MVTSGEGRANVTTMPDREERVCGCGERIDPDNPAELTKHLRHPRKGGIKRDARKPLKNVPGLTML